MGVNYAVLPMTEEKLKLFREAATRGDIGLPQPNPFMPKNLALVGTKFLPRKQYLSLAAPQAIIDNDSMLAYYAADQLYQTPKIFWRFTIKTPQINNGVAHTVAMADLYVKAFEDLIDALSYDAKMAEFDFSIERKLEGLQLTFEGYSDSAYRFLEMVTAKLAIKEISVEKFAIYKDNLMREYENFLLESPLRIAMDLFKGAVFKQFSVTAQKAEALAQVDREKFNAFLGQLFTKTFTDALLIGNLTETEANQVSNTFQNALGSKPFPRAEQTPVSVIELPEDSGPFFLQSKTHAQGNAALLGLEGDRFSPQERNVQQILGQVIREAFYAELRTKQQTGYLIFSSAEEMEKHLFTFFAVQSNSHGPEELLYRFEQFLEEYLQNLTRSEITRERFELLKGWLRVRSCKKRPKT